MDSEELPVDDEMGMDGDMDGDMGMDDMGGEEAGEEELEDRVVDLEDKLDELMAEFESLMGDDMPGDDMGGDDMEDMGGMDDMDSEEVVDDELETEGYKMPMEEAVSLKAVSKPTHGDNGANSKSPVAANSGAKGAMAKPVHATGGEEKGRPAPQAKDMGSTTEPNVKPATKPTLSQAAGVNNKSVIQ
jgi:hypothetical protein